MNSINRQCRLLTDALRRCLAALVCALAIVSSQCALAEPLYVIVNPALDIENMSKSDVINIYMGRDQKLGHKQAALPLDINNDYAEKSIFYKRLIDRDIAEVNSYWVRVMFSGQSSPPRQIDSYQQIAELVKDNIGAIAYVPESFLKELNAGDYKVVFVLDN